MTDDDVHSACPGAKKKHKKYPPECIDHVDLFRWLKELGWANETALRIARYEHSGKGLFSRKPIAAGDCLISLPFEAMIGLNALERDAEFRAMFDELALQEQFSEEKLPFQALLAIYLCAQELRKEPKYAAYLQSLPTCLTNPYFCTKRELSLLPYFVLLQTAERNKQIKSCYNKLCMVLKPEWQNNFTLERFEWAYFAVNSRSVYLDPDVSKMINSFLPDGSLFEDILADEPSMALAPFLDFFNHQSTGKMASELSLSVLQIRDRLLKEQPLDLFYNLHTDKTFSAGDQIFISYGTHNNTKLLLEYGFSVASNPDDFVEVTITEINEFIKHDPELRCLRLPREKYRFLADHQLDEQLFFVADDLISHNLAVCLTVLFVEQNIHRMKTIAFAATPPLEPIRSITLRLLEFLLLDVTRSLAGLDALGELSSAGHAYREYRRECGMFLNKIKDNF